MGKITQFDLNVLESISKVLGNTTDGLTGTEIGKLLHECRIDDIDSGNTKWKRLNNALANKQQVDGCANNVIAFIQHALSPARHYDNPEWFNDTRYKINKILSFEGLAIGENGKANYSSKAETISEAASKACKLKEHLLARNVHPDIITFCREELVVDNYFHAVFEATKSVAEKIRMKTGLVSDGAALVDDAFSFREVPHLAFNSLQSESEKNEQKGFMNLLKGLFGTFRNTTAHAPKITWEIEEQDALDILSMVSLVHRRLDKAIEAKKIYEGKI
ncbi:TIGR02391 family protein [Hydrogenovibrio thermophilus]|uniref:TIGR02391 family protein n=1 Tax=Hydrogenovibrio thermophilus TaxID=265883 RepID=A0A451G496_9GAMM|nr:TIGR02391 family protein [Hydrogenovibrio thermophilus]QAB14286.1 TIGR02391 family protein [Hydrogenovibrio thermophilus]